MKKLQHSVFSGLLILTLGFGLAGCGAKHDSAKSSSSSKDKVAKVTKVKKSSNNSKKQANSKKNSSSSQNNNSSNNVAPNQKQNTNSTNSTSTNSQKQLGLNDVAVWTDEKGVTHHVDSDGMDRQTTAGSSSTTYKDWSGSLPSNAQIIHQN